MIPTIAEVDDIESKGGACLGESFAMLQRRWESGGRDRETALRLLFLCWYGCCEPPDCTGLPGKVEAQLVCEAFDYLGGQSSSDPEVCFAVVIMAALFPYCMGSEDKWTEIGANMLARAKSAVDCLSVSVFGGRGAYGAYFGHMLAREKAANKQLEPTTFSLLAKKSPRHSLGGG